MRVLKLTSLFVLVYGIAFVVGYLIK